MNRTLAIITTFLILFAISFAIYGIYLRQNLTQHAQTSAPKEFLPIHFFGGFSADTPERATKAATDGVQVVFKYGQPPSESDKLGQKLQSLHMKVVDGYVWALVYYYECHRTKVLRPSLLGPGQYCEDDPHPNLVDENALLAAVADHLKQVKNNQLIIGYWVLDDWVQWDAGSARQLLVKIHNLIQQYTPDRPAICGFGGAIGLNKGYGWADWLADNFSPQGCDRVGFYIYAPTLPNTAPTSSPDAYDWSMSTVLPAMFASLQHRGWNIKKEPLIGIGQAFGGPIAHTNEHWITPTAKDIETQSRSFCEHGATGLVFYAWNNSGYGPATQTPMNNSEIETGIRNGITACRQYWSHNQQPTPVFTATAGQVQPSATPTVVPNRYMAYSFEDGGIDGWSGYGKEVTLEQNSTTNTRDGMHSLRVMLTNLSSNNMPYIISPVLSSSPRSGQLIDAYVYLSSSTVDLTAKVFVANSSSRWFSSNLTSLTPGTWNHLIYPLPPIIDGQVRQIGIQFGTSASTPMSSDVYIDAVGWN